MSRMWIAIIASVIIGVGLGVGVTLTLTGRSGESNNAAENEPLYWVAPMDPNYRRDRPGKSPMGMDLIPVYENSAAEGEVGAIRISPDVINNLGIRTGLVKHDSLKAQIHTVGYLQYNQDELVHINPRIAGWIETLSVKTVGDRVEKGQRLYQLYSPELVNAQQELLMALAQNNPQFIRAAEERLRTWQIPNNFIDDIRARGKVRQNVAYYAPKSGYLTALNVRQGEFVQPGQVLMAIGTLDDIWVEAQVFADQVHLLEVGLPVTMTSDYLPGEVRQGRVDYVYPSIDPVTRTQPVRIQFSNPEGALKPDMFADLVIHNPSEQATTLVPKEAVIRTGDMDRVVLALGDGRFKSVAVTVGREDDKHVEVISGVEAGERVVTSAQFLLDSESSKTSDFKRLHHGEAFERGDNNMQAMDDIQASAGRSTVTVEAIVNTVMANHDTLNVSHEPIDVWDWPAMTMDFDIAEGVDLTKIKPDSRVRLTIKKFDNNHYLVTGVEVLSNGERPLRHLEIGVEPESPMDMDHDSMGHNDKTDGQMEVQP